MSSCKSCLLKIQISLDMECFQDCPNLQHLSCLHLKLYVFLFVFCSSYPQIDDQAGPRPESSWTEELQEAVLLSDQPVPRLCQVKRLGRRRKTKENVVLFPLSSSLFDTVQCLCAVSLCFNSVYKMVLPFIYMTLLRITITCTNKSLLSLLPVCFPSKMSCLLTTVIVGS